VIYCLEFVHSSKKTEMVVCVYAWHNMLTYREILLLRLWNINKNKFFNESELRDINIVTIFAVSRGWNCCGELLELLGLIP
jgi:hypothetical protein